MVNFDLIGTRIKEQRKYICKISQEKMAEDLGMYQADISNIEKNKTGSGIADLYKLDQIAEYLNLPLETLLFGREGADMLKYYGTTMQLKPCRKELPVSHESILKKLTGQEELGRTETWECGPYLLYSLFEIQSIIQGKDKEDLYKIHTYVFLGSELIGVMDAALTSVMEHVYQPRLAALQELIPWQILDVTDVIRTLNPYWALWYFSEENEKEKYKSPLLKRMDELRSAGENRAVIYIESVYVREDCRRHGILRMYIDFLKTLYPGCILWLNLEPAAKDGLKYRYTFNPIYNISEIGQFNENAVIAEKLGFTIDPDPWHKKVKVADSHGNTRVEERLVHKCAYFLPPEIQSLLRKDNDLVAFGRAMQKNKIYEMGYKNPEDDIVSSNHPKRESKTIRKKQEDLIMKNYRISDVQIGEAEGGLACGPVAGPVIAEAKFTAEDGESFYLLLAEVDGIPNFYKTAESTFEKQIQETEDEAFWDDLNKNCFIETGDYDELFETKDPEYFDLYRYLIYLVRPTDTGAGSFIAETDGKLLSEISIPETEIELDYQENE